MREHDRIEHANGPCPCCDDAPVVVIMEGDAAWHDGPGWYYVDAEYRDEGSCGAFATRDEAVAHAREAGYFVETIAQGEAKRHAAR